jgi:hypothetical protein
VDHPTRVKPYSFEQCWRLVAMARRDPQDNMTDLGVELQDDVSEPVRTGKGLAGRIELAHATDRTRPLDPRTSNIASPQVKSGVRSRVTPDASFEVAHDVWSQMGPKPPAPPTWSNSIHACRSSRRRRTPLPCASRPSGHPADRKWSGKTLADHRADRKAFVLESLAAVGITKPEQDRSRQAGTRSNPATHVEPPRVR